MTTYLDDFESHVTRIVARADEARAAAMRELDPDMAQRLRAQSAFDRLAEHLHRDELRPRMEAVARHFDGARLQHVKTADGVFSKVTLPHAEGYPVGAMLTMGIRLDPATGNAAVTYRLETDPLLAEVVGHQELIVPTDRPDMAAAVGWIERQLLAFVETYLRIEHERWYGHHIGGDASSPRSFTARLEPPAVDAPAADAPAAD